MNKKLTPRPKPCICCICPDCGNVFMASVFSAAVLGEDFVLRAELERYAQEGFTIDVRNADEFELYRCKCETCNKPNEDKL